MAGVWMWLATAGVLAGILGGLAWLGSRARRRGVGGGLMGPFEEIWHPAAYQPHIEIRARAERKVPTPSPGDRPWRAEECTRP